ncbi:pitrilysin family protein [Ferruginibacter paludis]|uniref:M16 family metallopeptidase n=1 Tax=Ferruginibacter paludis TaxID=1310417 RepID=UPI0025B3B7D1|nr:pitrilysin family protein [Ferruginibacter paludis]MDN3658974.1 pitrilysin family protein [Ferruginibacter paludis]
MKKRFFYFFLMASAVSASAQKIVYTEYDLKNGLHVILHQDKSAPVVAVSVMYHVGSKDEQPNRTGFAHFFEHLLFEGSDNIKRGEFMKIVSSNGGQNNANTTQDRTFYYEVFPSNQLATGIWLESERMMHPVINEVGVKTQNEVVKEEKRLRVDNQPYGNFFSEVMKHLFTKHPYNWVTIGSMADLDAATLDEFKAFNKKYYTPNNAVLTIAGDIDIAKTKALVESYFADIPSGVAITRTTAKEDPITSEIIDTAYDNNIQIPAILAAYRVPGETSKESKTLEMASAVLSQGNSSRMSKKMVDDKKNSVQVGSFNYSLEDYGAYIIYALPNNETPLDTLLNDMNEEVIKLQTSLISESEFTKLQNQFENDYIGKNSKMLGVAENLADGYTFYKNTNNINTELDEIRKITRQDIQDVAKKYLNKNQRVVLYYLPKK